MYHEMKIFGFTIDSIASRPIVILKDEQGTHTIPLWISTAEAFAIAAELVLWESGSSGRTRDLMSLFLEKSGTEISGIMIEELKEGNVTAFVKFLQRGEEFQVEVRPCEAVLTALKYKRPVLVAENVLQSAVVVDMTCEELAGENNARRFADFLENLDPATLGKYPM